MPSVDKNMTINRDDKKIINVFFGLLKILQ